MSEESIQYGGRAYVRSAVGPARHRCYSETRSLQDLAEHGFLFAQILMYLHDSESASMCQLEQAFSDCKGPVIRNSLRRLEVMNLTTASAMGAFTLTPAGRDLITDID